MLARFFLVLMGAVGDGWPVLLHLMFARWCLLRAALCLVLRRSVKPIYYLGGAVVIRVEVVSVTAGQSSVLASSCGWCVVVVVPCVF